MRATTVCPRCNGAGSDGYGGPCSRCGTRGEVLAHEVPTPEPDWDSVRDAREDR